ncbi:hypothetical protein BN129_4333 [Cronobacter sakazakii 701]|nr:hypothetical protein BN129_4333 [Cronobacter sakazakii 701]
MADGIACPCCILHIFSFMELTLAVAPPAWIALIAGSGMLAVRRKRIFSVHAGLLSVNSNSRQAA